MKCVVSASPCALNIMLGTVPEKPVLQVAEVIAAVSFCSLSSHMRIGSVSFAEGAVLVALLSGGLCAAQKPDSMPTNPEPGLLFYLSGDQGFKADFAAGGNPEPNFLYDVK